VKVQLTGPQSEFYHSEAKYTAAVAGFGSGKTQAALIRILSNLAQRPGFHQAYLAPTYALVRDIFYPKAEEMLEELGWPYAINKSENTIYVYGLGKVICRTMEDPSKIVGWECADIFLDEFDILPKDKALEVFRKASARMRLKYGTVKKNQLYITTTPEGFKATYQLFKQKPLKDSKLVQMSTYSNAHNLQADYIPTLMDQYPEQLIAAYLNGEFVNLTSGSVYNTFDRDVCRSYETIEEKEPLYIGQDFNVGHMSSVICVKRDTGFHVVGELVDVFDTPSLVDVLKEKYPQHSITMYPDASGDSRRSVNASATDLALLRQAGFSVKANKKNPFVKDRILAVNTAFSKQRLFVNTALAPNVTSCLEQQAYDKNGEPDKSQGHDHHNDALGYLTIMEMPVIKPVLITGIGSAM